jgi:glucose-1-phosphate adenylyltransferase
MGGQVESATRGATAQLPARDSSLALILSDEPSPGLSKLTAHRCKAALPFGGKYRLIDFALSNCANSGIGTVGVITQYRPRSLHAHLDFGRPWDLDRWDGGLTLLQPYQEQAGIRWYKGSADALYQNLEFIARSRADHVLVLSGCEICCVDLDRLLARHREAGADLTICAASATAEGHETLATDRLGWVHRLVPPGPGASGTLVAMGVLVFSTEALDRRLGEDAVRQDSTHDLYRDVIPQMVKDEDQVLAVHHGGHWVALHTAYDYWRANLSLLDQAPVPLDDPDWPIRTRFEVRPPARVSNRASISHSLVSEGCVIEGTVERSILSPGVRIASGAIVRDAVVMQDTVVGEGASVEAAILDRDVVVGAGACVIGEIPRQARLFGAFADGQIAVVGRGGHIPDGAVGPLTWDGDWPLPADALGRRIAVA